MIASTAPLPHPRSRREVQRRLRSRLPERRDRRDPYAGQARTRTHTPSAGSAARDASASTGSSSSADGNSSTCFASIPAITTSIGRLGHSHSIPPRASRRKPGPRVALRLSEVKRRQRRPFLRPENPGASTVWAEHSRIAAYCFDGSASRVQGTDRAGTGLELGREEADTRSDNRPARGQDCGSPRAAARREIRNGHAGERFRGA
jgi:hypothetical protein